MFNQKENKIIAAGFTAKELVELLSTNKARDARKSLNYYDGQQEEEVVCVLNDPNHGRRNWKQRGLIPRFRAITQNGYRKERNDL